MLVLNANHSHLYCNCLVAPLADKDIRASTAGSNMPPQLKTLQMNGNTFKQHVPAGDRCSIAEPDHHGTNLHTVRLHEPLTWMGTGGTLLWLPWMEPPLRPPACAAASRRNAMYASAASPDAGCGSEPRGDGRRVDPMKSAARHTAESAPMRAGPGQCKTTFGCSMQRTQICINPHHQDANEPSCSGCKRSTHSVAAAMLRLAAQGSGRFRRQ